MLASLGLVSSLPYVLGGGVRQWLANAKEEVLMVKSRKNDTTAAELKAGSAENIIEDRAPALDGAVDVTEGLQQPDISDDRNAIATIFTGFQAAFTNEYNYTNPKTGELKVGNARGSALRLVCNNFMSQLDYVLKQQNITCTKVERILANARSAGDEDGSKIANYEAWLERESDTFETLVAMRDAARSEYANLFDHDFNRKPEQPTGSAARAAMIAN